ncbi:MAG: antitoxin [Chloroflexi bacterium]|nr:antitoxin [Chloroflexota bacterium]
MTKRLQVLLDDEELADIQRHARKRHQTTASWVRATLREARLSESQADVARVLAVLDEASGHSFPAPDIEQMLEEIERGYLEPLPE